MATLKCDGVSQTSDISKRNQVALVSHQLTERRSGVNGVFDNNDLDVIAGTSQFKTSILLSYKYIYHRSYNL